MIICLDHCCVESQRNMHHVSWKPGLSRAIVMLSKTVNVAPEVPCVSHVKPVRMGMSVTRAPFPDASIRLHNPPGGSFLLFLSLHRRINVTCLWTTAVQSACRGHPRFIISSPYSTHTPDCYPCTIGSCTALRYGTCSCQW